MPSAREVLVTARGDFLQRLRVLGLQPRTLKEKVFYLDEYLAFLGSRRAEEVAPRDVDAYNVRIRRRTHHGGRSYSEVAILKRLTVVKQFHAFLQAEGRALFNPCGRLQIQGRPRRLPSDLPDEDELALLIESPDVATVAGRRDRAFMEVLYSTGIRRGELINLNLGDADLADGVLHVRRGKGQKDRVVPLGRTAAYWVKRVLEDRLTFLNGYPQNALFLNQSKTRLSQPGAIVKRYKERLFPGRRISCHTFRHCVGAHMARRGANLRTIQELLGHEDITTTQIYTRLTVGDLKEALRRSHPRERGAVAGKGLDS